jgi:magnesium/cobalt transport protein CorA
MKKSETNIYCYLYDAKGSDDEVQLKDIDVKKLTDKQLLWVNILKRDEKLIRETAAALQLENIPAKSILDVEERPKIDQFEDFSRIFIVSVETKRNKKFAPVPIDFLVGKNFVITIHDGDVDYFVEFRNREKGETQIGELNAQNFMASLLDLHILSYFQALESIEENVDRFDEKILKQELATADFLSEMVRLRLDVSNLRRWLTPHRDVFYALARPDFSPEISGSDENFRLLSEHFENLVDSIESSRDTVLSLFDLYSTKSSQRLNSIIHRLTFITLIIGTLGVIAGVLGMNFDLAFFKDPNGFGLTVVLMAVFAVGLTVAARVMRWL